MEHDTRILSELRSASGIRVVVAVLVTIAALGCSTDSGTGDPDGAEVILLGGGRSEVHVVPSRVVVRSGDRVRFTTVDRRVHTIRFATDDMSEGARDFLEATGQERSPPLLERGAVFEVWFREAPRGFYPFRAEGPGEPVDGVIVVE